MFAVWLVAIVWRRHILWTVAHNLHLNLHTEHVIGAALENVLREWRTQYMTEACNPTIARLSSSTSTAFIQYRSAAIDHSLRYVLRRLQKIVGCMALTIAIHYSSIQLLLGYCSRLQHLQSLITRLQDNRLWCLWCERCPLAWIKSKVV